MLTTDFKKETFQKSLTQLIREKSSVAEICRRTGINRQQFHKYLSGENTPSVSKLFSIAGVLDVSIDELLGQSPKSSADNGLGLDELIASRCFMGTRQVAQGTYLEISTYDQEQETYLTSAIELKHTDYGGVFYRRSSVERLDGNRVDQELRGHCFEAGEKIMVYYANMTEANILGVLCLRRLDAYGYDLVGIKAAHRIDKSREPMAAPVALRYIGEDASVDDLMSMCGVQKLDALPGTSAVMVDYLKKSVVYEENRMRI